MTSIFKQALACGILGLGLISGQVSATVISGVVTGGTVKGSGTFVILDPSASPFTVGQDNFNTNNLYAFSERQNYTLKSDLKIDVGIGGKTVIAAGTTISSHIVFFDPAAENRVNGRITFDGVIIGIDRRATSLIDGNALFGSSFVTYKTPLGFNLENADDFVALAAPNASSLRVSLLSNTPGDLFRVFTVGIPQPDVPQPGVPEPATWAMMVAGFGLAGAGLRAARRNAANGGKSARA